MPNKLLFLPGAGGNAGFWRPVATQLNRPAHLFAWPGLGDQPPEPSVRGLGDLVAMVLTHLSEPADLIAQSMGGLVAVKAALAAPDKVRRLVLTATSGGIAMNEASDWRSDYYAAFPAASRWIGEVREDLSAEMHRLTMPILLLWGDADPISPISVGERLSALLPDARLHVVGGGGHDLAVTHAGAVADLIAAHLA